VAVTPPLAQSGVSARRDLGALTEAYERAQGSFLDARRAYFALQAAHYRGRFHDSESKDFVHLVAVFRTEAGEVHRQVAVLPGRNSLPDDLDTPALRASEEIEP
jgi:hypothetical protein